MAKRYNLESSFVFGEIMGSTFSKILLLMEKHACQLTKLRYWSLPDFINSFWNNLVLRN